MKIRGKLLSLEFLLLFKAIYVIISRMNEKRPESLSPVTLAYVGDAVFTLYVRTRLVETFDFKTGRLGKICSGFVCAATQSKVLEKTAPFLSDDEADIARRCRNAHTPSKAKNASMSDYKRATALEGIIGYLYLSGQNERLETLLKLFFDAAKEFCEPKEG